MNQSKTSAETPAPVKDQTTSPRLGQPGAGAPTPKNSPGKSGGTPDGNLSLPGNGKAEDAFPDPAELSHQIAKRSRELVAEFLKRQAAKDGIGMANPLAIFADLVREEAHALGLTEAALASWHPPAKPQKARDNAVYRCAAPTIGGRLAVADA
jgi:hypothetical protein